MRLRLCLSVRLSVAEQSRDPHAAVVVTLVLTNRKRNVAIWRPSVRLSICPVGIFTVTHDTVGHFIFR